ncbi:MAG: competence/damage-inducible protein A [Acetatifactor sp.]|nr:competence/damage-inducible protein A [Acetatifactor sp.]
MTVEIICVGTEILLGNIVNTNAAFLAEKCAGLGLSCYYQSVVGDNEERLTGVIKTAIDRSDVVILSGGLGPTEDDLTKEVACKVLGVDMVSDESVKEDIREYFVKKNLTLTDNNWKQAMVPVGGIVVKNNNGTAPGIIIEKENVKVILLPGPPIELTAMFNESIAPYLNTLTPSVIVSQTVKLCGISESLAETKVKDLIDTQTNPTIATYAKTGEVHIRVTASEENDKACKKLIKPIVKELKERFGNNVYTTDEDVTMERAVVELLEANDLTISCAESCTGGMVSARLINVPGASEVLKVGYVTYSNKAKRKNLGVKKSTLQKHGAVSKETATEMVKGLETTSKADVCIGITGIAGPDGGTESKPVGLVYIACSVKGKTTVEKYNFSGNRAKIRESATSAALVLCRRCILEYFSKVTFGQPD